MQPRVRSLDDPTKSPESTSMSDSASCDQRPNAATLQRLAVFGGIVRAIRDGDYGSTAPGSVALAQRWNAIDQWDQLGDVVFVRPGHDRRERDSLSVGSDVVLAAGTRTIGGIRTRFFPAPTARIDEESTTARDQSIRIPSSSRCSKARWSRSQTPASCQSRRRRQQVTPLPQPISNGRSSHGIPVRRTNRIPVNAARLSTGLRPGYFHRRALGLGRSGSTTSHNSSFRIGLAKPHPLRRTESYRIRSADRRVPTVLFERRSKPLRHRLLAMTQHCFQYHPQDLPTPRSVEKRRSSALQLRSARR